MSKRKTSVRRARCVVLPLRFAEKAPVTQANGKKARVTTITTPKSDDTSWNNTT